MAQQPPTQGSQFPGGGWRQVQLGPGPGTWRCSELLGLFLENEDGQAERLLQASGLMLTPTAPGAVPGAFPVLSCVVLAGLGGVSCQLHLTRGNRPEVPVWQPPDS